MSDDPLMRELADLVRKEREQDAALPAELHRPLDESELDAILDAAAPRVGAQTPAKVVALDPARAARAASAKRWAMVAGIAGPLAAAAIAVLVAKPMMTGSNETGSGVPPYDLVVEGGDRETRGAAEEAARPVVHLTRTGRLLLVARPRVPGAGEVAAKAMIERPDGSLVPWQVESRASSEGAVRIDARGAAIEALPAGASRVVVFVGAPSSLPADEAAAKKAMRGESNAVRVLAQPIDVAP
jgi:hypothetical protein